MLNKNFFLKILILLFFILIRISVLSQNQGSVNLSVPDSPEKDSINIRNYEQLIDSIIFYAEKYLGTRYRAGGYSSMGFDCSGFVSYVFSNFNIDLPRSSREQALKGMPLKKEEIRRGDLVFFKGRNLNNRVVGHVGLVVERNDTNIRFIHASRKKGICYDYTTSDYYKARYIGAKRLLGDNIRDSLWTDIQIADLSAAEDTLTEEEDSISVTTPKQEKSANSHYVVRKGDTLYSIAKRHQTSVEKIQTLNNMKGDKIYPGQKLKISN